MSAAEDRLNDPFQTAPAAAGTRTVTGQVDSTGTITAGSGFTVNRSATGVYDITFTTAFSAVPTVVAVPGAAAVIRILDLTAATTSTAQISTFNTGGTPTNTSFHFVAYETT